MAHPLLPPGATSMSVPTILLFPWSLERGSSSDALLRTLSRRRGTRSFPVRDNDPLPMLLRQWSAGVFVVVTNADLRTRLRGHMIESFEALGGRYQEMIMHAVEDDVRDLVDQITAAEKWIAGRIPGLTGS
jgi:hypothetical protein